MHFRYQEIKQKSLKENRGRYEINPKVSLKQFHQDFYLSDSALVPLTEKKY